ncbi:unnamed protein product [Cunninghamella blakesleeana]
MAPRRGGGGGGISIDFGSGGSSVDPYTLGNIFLYVTTGLYSLYYIYTIVATFKHKTHYPFIFLYYAVAYVTFGTIFSLLGQTVLTPVILYPAGIFISIGYSLLWLLTFEPSRHIMNLQNTDPTFERASIFRIKQYLTGGGIGYTLLGSYIYFFIYVLISVVAAIVGATLPINASEEQIMNINGLNIFISVGPWFYFLVWSYLTYTHSKLIPHLKSFLYYGFFLLLNLIGVCVLLGTRMSVLATYIVDFVLADISTIFAIYTVLRFGTKWVAVTKFDLANK